MSCLGNKYNPVPTKEWYRYENRCTYDTTAPLRNSCICSTFKTIRIF